MSLLRRRGRRRRRGAVVGRFLGTIVMTTGKGDEYTPYVSKNWRICFGLDTECAGSWGRILYIDYYSWHGSVSWPVSWLIFFWEGGRVLGGVGIPRGEFKGFFTSQYFSPLLLSSNCTDVRKSDYVPVMSPRHIYISLHQSPCVRQDAIASKLTVAQSLVPSRMPPRRLEWWSDYHAKVRIARRHHQN